MNESLADIYSLESPRQGIGKTIFDFSTREKAEEIRHNDFVVMENEVNFFTEEVVLSKLDEQEIPFLSLKYPWYNDQNELCGLFGLSIALRQQPLALSLNTIASSGFLFSNKSANHNMIKLLSNRELDVMQIFGAW